MRSHFLRTVSGSGGAFDPSQLSSTLVWYDGSDTSTITYNGSNQVSSWNDKIQSIAVSKTEDATVTYNTSGGYLTFTSTSVGLVNRSTRLGLVANPDLFVASVFETPNNLENRVVTVGDFVGTGIFCAATDISWRFNNGNEIYTEDVTTNTLELLVWQRLAGTNYGESQAFLNGTELSRATSANATTVPTNTTVDFGIGTGFQETLSGGFNGNIYEIVICESAVQSDREKIEGYLAHKHGLTANLPVGHPYKSVAP